MPGPFASPGERERYPAEVLVSAPEVPLHLNADHLMEEGQVLAVGARDVSQPEAGRHAWVIAIWYQVDPLQLRDGGQFTLLPDQTVGTLPPACWFCEIPWSFQAMRIRCPGRPPGGRR